MENQNEEKNERMLVSEKIARQDIEAWLDAKRIPAGKRKEAKEVIKTMTRAVVDGLLIWDGDQKRLTQVLIWPLGENEDIKTIEYKNRVTQGDISARMKGLNTDSDSSDTGDMTSKVMGVYLSAISGLNAALVDRLDTVDYNVAQAVISFFM